MSSNGDPLNDGLEFEDANISWQPIYVSMVLTSVECAFFLIVFECARRNKFVESVYDRRRGIYEKRMPPPLRKRSGLLHGWLAFEWWRLRVADKEYRRLSIEEFRREKERRQREENSNHKTLSNATDEQDPFLKKAERQCYLRSPYYNPCEEEDHLFLSMEADGPCQNKPTQDDEWDDEWEENEIYPAEEMFQLDVLHKVSLTLDETDLISEIDENSMMEDPVPKNLQVSLQKQEYECKKGGLGNGELRRNTSFPSLRSPPAEGSGALPWSSSLSPFGVFQLDGMQNASMIQDEGDLISENKEKSTIEEPVSKNQQVTKQKQKCECKKGVPGKLRRNISFPSLRRLSEGTGTMRRSTSLSSFGVSEDSTRKVGFVRRLASSLRSQRGQDGDISLGSEEAKRLAKFQFSQPAASENRDTCTLSSMPSALMKFVWERILLVQDTAAHNGQSKDYEYLSHDVARRSLTEEDQELLRCVGLDTFMTLRFLIFGFQVSLWPMFLTLPLLIPLYKTAEGLAIDGFYSTTIIALEKGSWRFWVVMVLLILQFLYILRRLWTEWELFLPLRYDFLENGDFAKEKYKEQYRETTLVEYVPSSKRHDKSLYAFFDAVFPGQIKRVEILLNIEHLRSLRRIRLRHIVAYENIYAKMVHKRAAYLRSLSAYKNGEKSKRCCLLTSKHREPNEHMAADETRLRDLTYHHDMIQKLNNEIDAEYIRLAQEQRRSVLKKKKSSLAKRLGLTYLTSSDTGHVHSSTAFVEFRSLAAKEHAIQCNIVGTKKCMVVTPVPEVRDLIWGNEHVSRNLIVSRKRWTNLLLTGGLVLWSLLVSVIRSYKYSEWFESDYPQNPTALAILNVYLPALVVEGLVRMIPFLIKILCKWVRFKSASETDHYILCWYFAYRLFTFVFVIEGDHLIDQSDKLIDDPVGFLLDISKKVAGSSQFFICYVIVTVTLLLARLSQIHNVVEFFYLHNIVREESLSQRRLDKLRTNTKTFHEDEFIPLFIFVFMVGALYGVIAPLSGIFVTGFFLVAYKVVRYMALYIYGNKYESGGFLFYTLSTIMFWVLYLIIIVLAGYLFSHDAPVEAGIFLVLLPITIFVHYSVHLTFVEPSKTLSLAKARDFETKHDGRSPYQRKLEEFLSAKQALDEEEERIDAGIVEDNEDLHLLLSASDDSSAEFSVDAVMQPDEMDLADNEMRKKAIERFQRRYEEKNEDSYSDLTESEVSGPPSDFFIYRQPSLNRASWEVAPRPYRESAKRETGIRW